MTAATAIAGRWSAPLLVAGFGAALALRVALGGVAVADSRLAGLAFAAGLLALSVAAGARLRVSLRAVVIGVCGGAVLCLPAVVALLSGGQTHRPGGAFVPWALVVTVVAAAEEAFLRGALFDAVNRWRGRVAAVLVGAVLFALLHVPLYGWHVVPLDLAVGVWLGALRVFSGSPTAPLVAHVTADLAGWWLV
ncbi:MAG: CPBP family intramembrane metalloprotease [Actinomycetota bacterium]|nr:CPBP family intramembrane metalloprotease [Actinomycetota bacterium]